MSAPRFYLDTSVFGGCFDDEFSKWTRRLFDSCRAGRAIVLVSTVTEAELAEAPDEVRALLVGPSAIQCEHVVEPPEALELTRAYLAAGVVSAKYRDDCRHVAIATVTRADVLVSWNFRHIVRFDRIRAFNAVNARLGYATIDIRPPMEVLPDDD